MNARTVVEAILNEWKVAECPKCRGHYIGAHAIMAISTGENCPVCHVPLVDVTREIVKAREREAAEQAANSKPDSYAI